MTFLNMALAFGAAAFTVPLVIHLLNRSRFRTVQWGAMHLLESVLKTNHRRFQLDQLLLLFVRCAIPVLLALCLARPLLTGSSPLEGDAPVSLVLCLDNSYSMNVEEKEGVRFKTAVSDAIALVQAAPRGSDIFVLLTGGKPTPLFDQPVFDPEAVIRKLESLEANHGASQMDRSLDMAVSTLGRMSHARRELVVISDFQKDDWSELLGESGKNIHGRLSRMPVPAEISLIRIGTPTEKNVAVESIDIPRQALGVGESVNIRVTVKNFDVTEIEKAKIAIHVDGKEHAVSRVRLPGQASTETLFSIQFQSPGSHVIEAQYAGTDALENDNRRSAAIKILQTLDVVLVNGAPDGRPLKNETEFLEIALTPFAANRSRLADLVKTTTVLPNKLDQPVLENARVLALANVSRLSDEQLKLVESFVSSGGVLFVFPGNRIDTQWYRESLYAGGTGLTPSPFGVLLGSNQRNDPQQVNAHIVAQHYDHPALEFFNERDNGDLSLADVFRWYQLKEPPDSAEVRSSDPAKSNSDDEQAQANVRVLARLDSGDPFLLEKRYGDGVVIQMATTCDSDWTNLPLQEAYLPMIQQMVTVVSARLTPPKNILAGEPASLFFHDSDQPVTVSVTTPDQSVRTLQSRAESGRQLVRFRATGQPGTYRFSYVGTTEHVVANASPSESELSQINNDQQKELAETIGGINLKSAADYLDSDRERRYGREIWRYLLAGLLVFMFLEVFLQQRFAKVRV